LQMKEIIDIEVAYKYPYGDVAIQVPTGKYKLKLINKKEVVIISETEINQYGQ